MKLRIALGMISVLIAVSARAQAPAAAALRTAQNQTAASNASAAGVSKIDPAKEADIRRLLDVMGAKAIVRQIMDGMEKNLKPMMVNSLPPGVYRDRLVELFFQKFQSKADTQQLLDLAVPGYDKYFSDEEIKGLIAFYQTPLGQKAMQVLPNLSLELQSQGSKWGQELGRQCMVEVLSEHPDLAQALAAAGKASHPQ
jgi:hypothetical protein